MSSRINHLAVFTTCAALATAGCGGHGAVPPAPRLPQRALSQTFAQTPVTAQLFAKGTFKGKFTSKTSATNSDSLWLTRPSGTCQYDVAFAGTVTANVTRAKPAPSGAVGTGKITGTYRTTAKVGGSSTCPASLKGPFAFGGGVLTSAGGAEVTLGPASYGSASWHWAGAQTSATEFAGNCYPAGPPPCAGVFGVLPSNSAIQVQINIPTIDLLEV